MIQYTSEKQLMLEGFETEFEKWIDPTNKWVELSHLIPWDELSEAYDQTMSKTLGRPSKDARLVIGSLILKHFYRYSDEEAIEQIQMNPYYQYFVGFKAFQKAPAFCPTLFVDIRKRMDEKVYKEFEKSLTDEIERIQSSKTAEQKLKTLQNKEKDKKKENKNSNNKGTLIVDATIADQDIRYPTDLSLLNEAREMSEKIIDKLYKQSSRTQKPRTYRQIARKAFITCAKQKRLSNKKRRQGIKKQLQYLRRNLAHIESLLDEQTQPVLHQTLEAVVQMEFPLSKKSLRRYYIIQQLYHQQRELYQENKRSIADRIVSIHQPQVRPMVRGKAGKKVEFGAKLGVAINEDGMSYVDHLSWDAYNETNDIEEHIENYKKVYGHYPEVLLGDQIYGTRKNRKLLKEKGIRFGGKPLGRPKKQTQENKKEIKKSKQQQKEDHRNRIPIEGKFGQGKQGYRLNNILARTAKTSESWIRNIFFVMNLLVLAKVFIWLELNSCIDVLIEKIIHLLNIKDRPEYVDASYPQLCSSRG
ncbi:MAG: IS5 family transposase [Cocleimonas sp.]|nr:IS5 family transposase [Cocleimonas sp.]